MSAHPYLRAYMAGVAVPSVVLIVAVTAFSIARYGFGVDVAVERVLVFPLAIVPACWGVWNMLHMALEHRSPLTLGLHGAVLPLILVPAGVTITHALNVVVIDWRLAWGAIPIVMIIYYLVWKHLVGFLNAELGVA